MVAFLDYFWVERYSGLEKKSGGSGDDTLRRRDGGWVTRTKCGFTRPSSLSFLFLAALLPPQDGNGWFIEDLSAGQPCWDNYEK